MCNPSYTNAIGVEIMTTQMWSLSKLCFHNCDESWKCGYKRMTTVENMAT